MSGPDTVGLDLLSVLIREATELLRQLNDPGNYKLLGEHTVLQHRVNSCAMS